MWSKSSITGHGSVIQLQATYILLMIFISPNWELAYFDNALETSLALGYCNYI
jgi:hypothetical protein